MKKAKIDDLVNPVILKTVFGPHDTVPVENLLATILLETNYVVIPESDKDDPFHRKTLTLAIEDAEHHAEMDTILRLKSGMTFLDHLYHFTGYGEEYIDNGYE